MRNILFAALFVLVALMFYRAFDARQSDSDTIKVTRSSEWSDRNFHIEITEVQASEKNVMVLASLEIDGTDKDVVYLECLTFKVDGQEGAVHLQDETASKLSRHRGGLSYKNPLWKTFYWSLNSRGAGDIKSAIKRNEFEINVKKNCPLIATEFGIEYWNLP